MELIERFRRGGESLAAARGPESERIVDSLRTSRVVGVLGEAEVGKTAVIERALAPRAAAEGLLSIDLDGATGEHKVAFQIVKQIAAAYLGSTAFSLLSADVLVPASLEPKRVELARIIGVDGLEEALRAWPSGGLRLDHALVAIERFATERDTVVWVDHAEAPSLTPRHPLDVDQLMWKLRAMLPEIQRLSLIVSARDAFKPELLGRRQALYEQGRWLTLDNPAEATWLEVADDLGVEGRLAAELVELTRGHPQTTLRALAVGGDRRAGAAGEVIRDLATTSVPLAARAAQHARSLHRLGGQLLSQVARGEAPYGAAQKGNSPQQEITRVLRRLRLAGLLRHDPGGWSVTDPLVGAVLRGEVHPTVAADLPGR